MPKKHCLVVPFFMFSVYLFIYFFPLSFLQVITLTKDDVTRKYYSMFSFVKSNENYGVLAKTYCIIIIVITIADVVANVS